MKHPPYNFVDVKAKSNILKLRTIMIQSKREYYCNCHLAGRQYKDADLVWKYLEMGSPLKMILEERNPYDPNAVLVIYTHEGEDYIIGYLPKAHNEDIAKLLRMGWGDIFECRISKLNPDEHYERQIRLSIHIRKRSAE